MKPGTTTETVGGVTYQVIDNPAIGLRVPGIVDFHAALLSLTLP